MAKVITTRGEHIAVTPESKEGFTLKEVYGHIGCEMVQLVPFMQEGHKLYMLVDEEGLLNQKPLNNDATSILRMSYKADDIVIVGDVLICTPEEFE